MYLDHDPDSPPGYPCISPVWLDGVELNPLLCSTPSPCVEALSPGRPRPCRTERP